jgi:lipid A 3-O-deacylase
VKNLALAFWVAAALSLPAPARAEEIFGGLMKHDVDTPLTIGDHPEGGVDVQLGWRGGRIGKTPIQPYVFGALNSSGDTSFAAIGLSARFGDKFYIRPGVGLAVHTGSAGDFDDPTNDKVEFGSRLLFEPEVGIGVQLTPRISAEASWVHLSHAQLFGRQNPGIDTIGVRVNVGF